MLLVAASPTDEQLAIVFDVTSETINQWKKDKRFSLHLKKGKHKSNQKVFKIFFSRVTGIERAEATGEPYDHFQMANGQEQHVRVNVDFPTM